MASTGKPLNEWCQHFGRGQLPILCKKNNRVGNNLCFKDAAIEFWYTMSSKAQMLYSATIKGKLFTTFFKYIAANMVKMAENVEKF